MKTRNFMHAVKNKIIIDLGDYNQGCNCITKGIDVVFAWNFA